MALMHRSQNISNTSFVQAALSKYSRPSMVSFKTFNKRKQSMILITWRDKYNPAINQYKNNQCFVFIEIVSTSQVNTSNIF